MGLKGVDIVSAKQFDRDTIFHLFRVADEIKDSLKRGFTLELARGKLMITAFFEPSTRTKISFQVAMLKLGGMVVDFDVSTSSVLKGETDVDTMIVLDRYEPDIIVVRQSKPFFLDEVKDLIKSPLINAGDGWNEHPTQALLDAYTIWKRIGRLDNLVVGIMGDLRYGRTPSSLSYLLSKFSGNYIYYIAPPELQIREEVLRHIEGKVGYSIVNSIDSIKEELDVLYVTRLQVERISNKEIVEKVKGSFRVTKEYLMKMGKVPLIMHPLPRTWELDPSVDSLPQAAYFEQVENGLYVRAALIKEVLGL